MLHTHQTWATALCMLKDNRLLPATQTAAFYYDLIAYDDDYQGTADYPSEGERLAALMGDKPIVFMKNHGILVTGETIAQAYRRLYKIERCARMQMLALATGKPINVLSDEVIARGEGAGRAGDAFARRARPPLLRSDDARARPRDAGYAG